MQKFLAGNVQKYQSERGGFTVTINDKDFIDDAVWHIGLGQGEEFDYAILNPPT